VIAHRLSDQFDAPNKFWWLKRRIVERGTHSSLYAAQGRYFEMYTKQHGLEEKSILAPGEFRLIRRNPQKQRGGIKGAAAPDPMRIIRGTEPKFGVASITPAIQTSQVQAGILSQVIR